LFVDKDRTFVEEKTDQESIRFLFFSRTQIPVENISVVDEIRLAKGRLNCRSNYKY
jgi:hypothetical protein